MTTHTMPPEVKLLEWERAASSMHDAIGYGGLYRVHLRDGDWRLLVNGSYEGTFENESDAKAAGQLHHKTKVLSALEPSGEGVGAEAWRPVVGYEGLYEVSDAGDLRRVGSAVPLAKNTMGLGYIKAELWRNNKRKQTSVHRLVAEAFIPNPSRLPEVNHKDGDKTNNRTSNLEWVSPSQNVNHAYYELSGNVHPLIATRADGTEEHFASTQDARRAGHKPQHIYACCKGTQTLHHGMKWRYAHDTKRSTPVSAASPEWEGE